MGHLIYILMLPDRYFWNRIIKDLSNKQIRQYQAYTKNYKSTNTNLFSCNFIYAQSHTHCAVCTFPIDTHSAQRTHTHATRQMHFLVVFDETTTAARMMP